VPRTIAGARTPLARSIETCTPSGLAVLCLKLHCDQHQHQATGAAEQIDKVTWTITTCDKLRAERLAHVRRPASAWFHYARRPCSALQRSEQNTHRSTAAHPAACRSPHQMDHIPEFFISAVCLLPKCDDKNAGGRAEQIRIRRLIDPICTTMQTDTIL
jgi:hypothetical protein